MKTRILRPLLILPTSSMRSKSLSVKSSSTLKHTPLLHKGSPSQRSDEGSSSGSYGDKEYYSTQFRETSGGEVDGLHLESEEYGG